MHLLTLMSAQIFALDTLRRKQVYWLYSKQKKPKAVRIVQSLVRQWAVVWDGKNPHLLGSATLLSSCCGLLAQGWLLVGCECRVRLSVVLLLLEGILTIMKTLSCQKS